MGRGAAYLVAGALLIGQLHGAGFVHVVGDVVLGVQVALGVADGDVGDVLGGTVGTTTNSDFPYYPEMNNELNGDEDYAGGQGGRDMNLNETTRQEEVLAFTITDAARTM